MFQKKAVRQEPLTPELVKQFRQLTPLPGERELKKARLLMLSELIRGQQFTGTNWATVLDKSSGIIYRGNGQHSSYVLDSLDGLRFPTKPDGSPLVASIEEWEMDDVHRDGLRVFDCFDNPKSVRNNTDRMSMAKAAYPDVKHLRSQFLIAVVNAVEAYRAKALPNEDPVESRYRGEVLLEIESVRDFANWLSQYFNCDNSDFIRRKMAMAVAYEGWLDDPQLTATFWGHVFNEDVQDPNDETRIFAEELKATRARTKKGEKLRSAATRAWKRYLRDHKGGAPTSPQPQPTP